MSRLDEIRTRLAAYHKHTFGDEMMDTASDLGRNAPDDLAWASAEIERLTEDKERLDWMEGAGATVMHGSQPDMGGRDWSCSARGRHIKPRQRSPREAIDAARAIEAAARKETV